MALNNVDYAVCISILAITLAWVRQKSSKSKLPLPPGPPRWPLIGSLLALPPNEPNWKAFVRWGQEKKSDVVYIPIPGDNLIILNSHKAITELLERRSALYSGRPRLVMAGDIVGWDQILGLITYGDRVRHIRRLLHDGMNPKAMQAWLPYQEHEALKFIHRLLDTPQDLLAHIRQTSGASVLKITYGYTVHDNSDEYIITAEKAMHSISVLTTPGAFLVDMFPWLQYIPWTPYEKIATEARKYVVELSQAPLDYVHKQMRTGEGEPSLTSQWLETPSDEKDYDDIVKWAAASLYVGGADTTVSVVNTFFIGMLYNPSAQLKAQNELSQLLQDKLPTSADREQLPYIEAIYKEAIRWQPVGPLGLPHRYMSDTDDEYEGMRIPANSTILANIWGILRDPSTYKDPDVFNPDRFLGPNPEPNPEDVAFGFGRRRCPGIHVAQSAVWLSIALTLAAYDITPIVDEDRKDVLPSLEYSGTTISHPPPFQCRITPRSDKIRKIIEDAVL